MSTPLTEDQIVAAEISRIRGKLGRLIRHVESLEASVDDFDPIAVELVEVHDELVCVLEHLERIATEQRHA